MILAQLRRPIIFAHRGASACAPENTLAAFRLAIDQGADAIELDAKLSHDQEVVVIHDQTVDRTTNGQGTVRSLRLTDLKKLDAGSFFSKDYTGEPIPTLEEVFEEVGKKIYINVELTNYASPGDGLVDRVVSLVKRHALEDWVLFSSFNPRNLLRARRLLPEVAVGLLALPGMAGFLARSRIGQWVSPDMIHPHVSDATENYIRRQHDRYRRVHVWTVNDAEDMARLFRVGVDGIFTDDPLLARRVLEGR